MVLYRCWHCSLVHAAGFGLAPTFLPLFGFFSSSESLFERFPLRGVEGGGDAEVDFMVDTVDKLKHRHEPHPNRCNMKQGHSTSVDDRGTHSSTCRSMLLYLGS